VAGRFVGGILIGSGWGCGEYPGVKVLRFGTLLSYRLRLPPTLMIHLTILTTAGYKIIRYRTKR